MAAMVPLGHRSLRFPRSLLTPSASKLHQLRALLKDIQVNKHNLNHSRNLELSLPRQMSFLPTTQRIRNSVMPILLTTITSSSTDYNKVPKVSRMALRPNDHIAVMVHPNLMVQALNSLRVRLNSPNHASRLLVKVKPVATRLQTQLLRLNSKEVVKEVNLSQVTLNNPKLLTILTVTLITRAHIMLNI